MGLNQGILISPGGVDFRQSSTYHLGMDESLQKTVVQLAILFDEVSIVSHETPGFAEEQTSQGLPTISTKPLKDMGIVTYTDRDINSQLDNAVSNAGSFEEMWRAIKEDLEVWEPIIIPYLIAKKVISHTSVYWYVKQRRMGDESSAQAAWEQIPQQFRNEANSLENIGPTMPLLDLVLLMGLSELLEAEEEARVKKSAIAHFPFGITGNYTDNSFPEGVTEVFEIVIDQLFHEQLMLPFPDTLIDVQRFRADPNIKAFRNTFQPWIESLSHANYEDEKSLRAEVKAAARAFNNSPRLEAFSNFLAYVALPAIFIPPPVGTPLGLALGVAGIGLPKLAKRWQEQGSWLSFCHRVDSPRGR
jgi:hypothetical protein